MKAKKWLVVVTGFISLVSIVAVVLCNYVFNFVFGTNFCFAILGSSLLGFIMSLIEYFAEKRIVLEEYYIAIVDLHRIYSTAMYLFIQEPQELLEKYYKEQYESNIKICYLEESAHEAKDNLLMNIRKNLEQTVDILEPEFSEYVQKEFDKKIHSYNTKLSQTIKSYIAISETNMYSLENAYGKLDFIFGNKSFRTQIYNRIHYPIQQYKHFIDEKAFHFRTYLQADNGNTRVMLEMINEIQQKYYQIVDKSNQYEAIFIIYEKFLDDINDQIESLRCKMYKQKYVRLQHVPLIQYIWETGLHDPKIG